MVGMREREERRKERAREARVGRSKRWGFIGFEEERVRGDWVGFGRVSNPTDCIGSPKNETETDRVTNESEHIGLLRVIIGSVFVGVPIWEANAIGNDKQASV
ncbi:uncharacterized protein G2W53_010894 [Senna tora]|uniref:Uncharacterized protein n=1 Tax=Senna tora TaxID=362788 RepID=A0A834X1R5_9FABA|nr:uncharacterized protein G2W53_010894 [Senna tora]